MHDSSRLLQELVAIPSINPMGRTVDGDQYYEYNVTNYLEQFFRNLRVPYERQHVAPRRENIVARFENPQARRTMLWEAHQDTVPIENMTIDPFGASIENGKLYGRGACDIKGGMSSMLSAFARLVREKPKDAMNVIIACTVDEEHQFLGVKKLIELSVMADMAIVAEPTQLKIVHAHKGTVRWHLATKGRACHSSAPHEGVSAIYAMAQVLAGIEQYSEHLQSTRIDPLLGPPTISVGRIEGGSSVNTVPDTCRIEIDRRVIPGEDPYQTPAELVRFLQERCKLDMEIKCDEPWTCLPALSPELSGELVTQLGGLLDELRGTHEVIAVPYGTDAPPLAAAGIPVVVFGPGNLAQAHTRDEWVSLDEIEEAAELYYQFAARG